jgi:hypothetical protein
MKLTKKILAITSVAVLATGSLIGTPVKAQGVNQRVLNEASLLTARGLCVAHKGGAFFKELQGRKYSEWDVVTVALKYAGGPSWESLSGLEMKTLITNQESFSSQLDDQCLPPANLVFKSTAQVAGKSSGRNFEKINAAQRQECYEYLSKKYGVFTQGQLSSCVGNVMSRDFMSGN